jgi:hypothetical protein
VPEPETGWTAFLVELEFESNGASPYTFTTQVRVLPEPATLDVKIVNESWGRVHVEPNLPTYYDPNTTVTLTAEPDGERRFKHWKLSDPNHPGDANHVGTDANNPLTIVMDADCDVTAVFTCGSGSIQELPLLLIGAVLAGLTLRLRQPRA